MFRCHSDSLLYAFLIWKSVNPAVIGPLPVLEGGQYDFPEYDEGGHNKVLYQNSWVELCDFVQKQVQFVLRNLKVWEWETDFCLSLSSGMSCVLRTAGASEA